MKHTKRLLPALLALLLVSCAVPAEPADKTDTTPSKEAASLPEGEARTEGESFIRLSSRLGTADLASMKLEEIYHLAEDLVDEGKPILIEKNTYTTIYAANHKEIIESTDENTEQDEDSTVYRLLPDQSDDAQSEAVYAVFLAILESACPDNIIDADADYDSFPHNRARFPCLLYSDSYREAGYNSLSDYNTAMMRGECEISPDCCYLSYVHCSVMNCLEAKQSGITKSECLDKWTRH